MVYILLFIVYISVYFRNCYFLLRVNINNIIFVCVNSFFKVLNNGSDVLKYFKCE